MPGWPIDAGAALTLDVSSGRSLIDLSTAQIRQVIACCAEHGVHVKWFGADEPVGFTSVWTHWRYFGEPQALPSAERVLGGLCDMRLPLTLSRADCDAIGTVVRAAMASLRLS